MKAVTYFLRDTKADKETPINAFFHFDGHQVKLSTGTKIHPKNWNPTKQRAKRGTMYETAINDRLDRIAVVLADIYTRLRNNGIAPTPELVKEQFWAIDRPAPASALRSMDIFEAYERFITNANTRPATVETYRRAKNHLQSFAKAYGLQLTFERIDSMFFEKFTRYLINVAGLNNNSTWNVIKNLKVFLKGAEKEGLTTNTAYREFSVQPYQPALIYLTQDELSKLHTLDLADSPRLDHARNLFLLQCYTGLRYSDLAQLRPEHITPEGIRIFMVKTGDSLTVPLSRPAREILAKFPDCRIRVITNQKLNNYVKELAKLAEINTPWQLVEFRGTQRVERTAPKYELIGTHTGRRTFVTLSLEKGIRPETLMKITGHKNLKTLYRYAVVTNRVSAMELERVWG